MATISVRQNGPYIIEGEDVTVQDWNGQPYRPVDQVRFALCRCAGPPPSRSAMAHIR